MSLISDFWKQIDGPIHPLDFPILEKHGINDGPFELSYPPPAFWGDVDGAPVLLLFSNGGFRDNLTNQEFENDPTLSGRYINALRSPASLDPRAFSKYFDGKIYSDFIQSGDVALVNAVPYRSKSNNDPRIRQLNKSLPSANIARRWLVEEAMPDARKGKRLIILHRWSLWLMNPDDPAQEGVHFSTNPVSERPSQEIWNRVTEFLRKVR